MSAGVVVKATLLLVVAVQFFIEDAEGQLLPRTTLDECISSMKSKWSLEKLKDKLSEDLSQWQPSMPDSVMYWMAKQFYMYPEKGDCRKFDDALFRNVIWEVYGRSLAKNFLIKASIIGWKIATFYHKPVLLLLSPYIAEMFLEYIEWPVTRKVVGVAWSTVAGAVAGKGLGKRGKTPPVITAVVFGIAPWLYCEIYQKSLTRLSINETYFKSDVTEILTNK